MLNKFRVLFAVGSISILAACNAQSDRTGSDAAAESAPVRPAETIVASNGLRLKAEGDEEFRSLAFGAAQTEVTKAVAEQSGLEGQNSSNEECGAGPMQFVSFDNLTLNFQDGAFVGWFIDGPSPIVKTPEAVGIGSIRETAEAQMLIDMQPDSTLGNEFLSDRGDEGFIGGFLSATDPNAVVESLYAGTNCFFR